MSGSRSLARREQYVESLSQSTDDASTHLTPSDNTDSDDGLTTAGDNDAGKSYKLRHLPPLRERNGTLRVDEAENTRFLPSPRRLSMSSAQSYELYTPDEDRAVLKKLDRRLVLFMALLYCLSFLDRSNIGNARIAGLQKDLYLSSQQYEWLLWAFYITYIAFEWMTLMYRIIPPHIYISTCILSWGIIASLQSVSTSFGFLLVLRAFLGIGEAAFGPGVPFYLSFFFRRNELAFRTGLFISASPLSASFAGALAWVITKLGQYAPLRPWRLLFLLEGFPSVLIAVWAWDFIPDSPGTAKFLGPRLREVAVLRLRQEKEDADAEEYGGEEHGFRREWNRGVDLYEVFQTLRDPKCYLTAFMFFSCNVAFSSMPVFLPTIIRDMGHTSLKSQALSVPPYLFAFIIVLITAYLSDRFQSRSIFIMMHSFFATLGYTTIALSGYYRAPNHTLRYLALYPAAAGFFSAITIIITWTINNQENDSRKGTGMAILNIIGQMGPLVGTSIFPETDAPFYVRGMGVCACFMALVAILAFSLRQILKMQNKKHKERERYRGSEYAGIPLTEGGMTELPGTLASSSKAAESPENIPEKTADDSEKSSTDIRSPRIIIINNEVPTNDFMPEADLEKMPGMPRGETESMRFDGDDEDPPIPVSFQRSSSPAIMQRNKGAAYEKVGEEGINRMHKFSLYETSTRFYLVGGDIMDKHYRVLKIDRTAPPGNLNIFEDDIVYDKREMNQLLNAIDDGNKGAGGMKLKCSTWGLLGFIRFTEAYYMLLITKRAQVAMIGGHYIYRVDGTELIPLTTGSTSRFQKDRNPEEARFLSILNNLDLTRSFYFSYSYNITRSLQQNIIRERQDFQDMFVWNHYLLGPARAALKSQSSIDIFGRRVYITIIARRSRFFAGARFLKRGANDLGYVANDVESEQIVSEGLTTSFHAPGPRLFASPTYTSYDNTGVTPKPDIDLNLADPFYSAAALHFDNLFERYGTPVYSKLLHEYQDAIKILGQDVIGTLEHLAEEVLQRTGFFHNGDSEFDSPKVQNGVARTNCIDCLDRTNAAQFLQVLGVIAGNTVEYDSDCVDIFTQMFHGHGDAIAIQYGGSHLVNTMATYRKINHWQSSSRDMVESFKRYYHNSFLDSQRQEAYNLFLGNYIFAQGQPMLWDLTTDYYLHHEDPRSWLNKPQRGYINWYTLSNLEPRGLPPSVTITKKELAEKGITAYDDYWLEYYRPLAISSFLKIFAFRLNSPTRHAPDKSIPSRDQDISPFVIRKKHDHNPPGKPEKKAPRKGVTIVDPSSETDSRRNSIIARRKRGDHLSVPGHGEMSPVKGSILRGPHFETQMPSSAPSVSGRYPSLTKSTSTSTSTKNFIPADKSLMNQWTLAQFYDNSLNPSVTNAEQDEYSRYIEHPLNLPLVVSSETPSTDDPGALEFYEYLSMNEGPLKSDAASMCPTTADTHSLHFLHHHYLPSVSLPPLNINTEIASIRSTPLSRPTSAAGLSINTPFSHPDHPNSHNVGTGKFQVSDRDLEEYEEFLKAKENPLDVLEDDGGKKRYKAYRQWLKGKSFFKQSKVDPEWQNQLPGR
ncbi:hypothetical protein K469DRAFT_724694 [Zopfia rhizophila CBS 207.26]|uniref:SAC domain-containing protein n=1 Tax=Zopfia rhizophila CBS 207.26 TaxID=1314779 RepID=A0A6A6EAL4_9PEZI|nr:hypothetical protein K469DRAFT_724694 [Zopfia rhizophila CBS 207.26]